MTTKKFTDTYIDMEKRFCFPYGFENDGRKLLTSDYINIQKLFDNLKLINGDNCECFRSNVGWSHMLPFKNFMVTYLLTRDFKFKHYSVSIDTGDYNLFRIIKQTFFKDNLLIRDYDKMPTAIDFPEFLPHIRYLCDYIEKETREYIRNKESNKKSFHEECVNRIRSVLKYDRCEEISG